MVLTMAFRAQVLDTELFIVVVRGNDVNADGGILFFEFRNLFGLDGKIDSVKIESILVPSVVRNTICVVADRIQSRQNGPHETFLVSVNDIDDRVFL